MNCTLCPVSCNADRDKTSGFCGVSGVKIAKYYLHPYEEPPISFDKGSGCVFFCGCSLRCAFCQNYELSRNKRGKDISVEELAHIFKELEDAGADNINLVNPTHYVNHIERALGIYRPNIPIVYNTHGYERLSTLERVDKFVDIYLTDLKFIDDTLSKRYTARSDYSVFALPAVRFMAKKPLLMENGKMLSGCIVRHLILPQAVYDTVEVLKFFTTLPETAYLSLMSQYTPCGDIQDFKELQRGITKREYDKALATLYELGIKNVFLQDRTSAKQAFIPKWDF